MLSDSTNIHNASLVKKAHVSKRGLANFSNCALKIQHGVTTSNADVLYHDHTLLKDKCP